ncbi:tryptophanyl-tRNA synthetase [Pancytospora philotis]|nr:tryptophanyl-tRNA synthetase [Pancytospora philotis]
MAAQEITPWNVEAECKDGKMAVIDYDHLISQFGCTRFDDKNLEALQGLARGPVHRLLRRNLVFAHRDFDKILECIAKDGKFYMYTGRGPSSKSMHIGHALPFLLCKYIQDAFRVPFVVQLTDDEKFLCKDISIEQAQSNALDNIKDMIAFGFDPELTYIFSNYESSHHFYANTLRVSKSISLNEAMKVFGFDINTNIGMVEFPAKQIAAAFASSFSFLSPDAMCLIPCAVDQDPYFRIARDKAFALKSKKPSTLYLSMLPDLQGTNKKMSASSPKTTIYLSDTPSDVKNKINRLAFSGGRETLEEHRQLGGDPTVDVPFQYLRYFLEDDQELERLRTGYLSGAVTTGEMKKRCIEVIQEFLADYQARRKLVTDETARRFMDISRFKR